MKERRLGSLGFIVSPGSVLTSFSPCGRRWRGRSPCRMRGYGLSIVRDPSPVANSLRSFAPPSPTRGEGKKATSWPVRIEPLLKSLPAIRVIILQGRRLRRMLGHALRIAGLEHEGHGARQLDRL